ncbi:MAG: sensor histidine kinase [Sulfuricella denitrificans]|nr:sensor histidine kinase [Sulfuricella denitrificans]
MTTADWCASQDELQRLSAQLLEIQESERQRIAIDLHDVLGQSLTMIKLGVEESLHLLVAKDTGGAIESLQRLKLKAKDACNEVRRVAMDLRPSTLDDLGILATLSWFFREFGAACQDMKVEREISIEEGHVPIPLKITIFRIIQEATSNVVKHANAGCIRVCLKKIGNALYLLIEDDGDGFDLAEMANFCPLNKGLGLMSMKERAKLSGGHYELASAPGAGTSICVLWPLGGAATV